MELRKVVLRYLDARTESGYAPLFESGSDLLPAIDLEGIPRLVPLGSLKAVFFVRTFSGNPDYDPPRDLAELPLPAANRVVQLEFSDGERIFADMAAGEDGTSKGFFVTVLDPDDNNLLIYVNPAALSRPPVVTPGEHSAPGTPEALFEP